MARKGSPMTQHYSRHTVSASHYCSKCGKFTQHRIDHERTGAGRKGPCLDCIKKLDEMHAAKEIERQGSLFREAT